MRCDPSNSSQIFLSPVSLVCLDFPRCFSGTKLLGLKYIYEQLQLLHLHLILDRSWWTKIEEKKKTGPKKRRQQRRAHETTKKRQRREFLGRNGTKNFFLSPLPSFLGNQIPVQGSIYDLLLRLVSASSSSFSLAYISWRRVLFLVKSTGSSLFSGFLCRTRPR